MGIQSKNNIKNVPLSYQLLWGIRSHDLYSKQQKYVALIIQGIFAPLEALRRRSRCGNVNWDDTDVVYKGLLHSSHCARACVCNQALSFFIPKQH